MRFSLTRNDEYELSFFRVSVPQSGTVCIPTADRGNERGVFIEADSLTTCMMHFSGYTTIASRRYTAIKIQFN